MRIAIVGTELCAVDRRGGGLEQVLLRWARHLAGRHDVTVVSFGSPEPEPGVEVVRVVDPSALRPTLARLTPDVVSLHNRPQWSEHVTGPARATVTFHNYPAAWMVAPETVSLPESGRASAVSSALAASAGRVLGTAVAVTPPSIDPVYLQWRAPQPEPVVLSPNRLLRKKGVEQLLQVARRPEFADVTFAFADLISPWAHPTAEHRELRQAVRAAPNAVLLAPARSPAELAERYRRSAVVACAVTEDEGLGLVALEAQACGVPLVSVDLGGLREATFPPNICVAAGDIDGLASGLRQSIGRPEPAAAPARREVVARYSPEASGDAFAAWLTAPMSGC